MAELRKQTTFPIYEKFKSSLPSNAAYYDEFRSFICQKFSQSSLNLNSFLMMAEKFFGLKSGFLIPYIKSSGDDLIFADELEHKIRPFLHTSPKDYEEARFVFEARCQNMMDYLRHYTILDCR